MRYIKLFWKKNGWIYFVIRNECKLVQPVEISSKGSDLGLYITYNDECSQANQHMIPLKFDEFKYNIKVLQVSFKSGRLGLRSFGHKLRVALPSE
jgi:hypothetical protein